MKGQTRVLTGAQSPGTTQELKVWSNQKDCVSLLPVSTSVLSLYSNVFSIIPSLVLEPETLSWPPPSMPLSLTPMDNTTKGPGANITSGLVSQITSQGVGLQKGPMSIYKIVISELGWK